MVHRYIQETSGDAKADRFASLVVRKARQHAIPPMILARLIRYESEYDPSVVSYAGACGLMQIMPTHFRRGENWRNPADNLDVGCRVLNGYKRRFQGWHPALVAYNRGPGNGPHRGIYRTRYSRKILGELR